MTIKRLKKQVTYAGGCSLLLILVAVGAYFLIRPKEAPPVVVPTPGPRQAIVVEEVAIVDHVHSVDVVARLRNPNQQSGVANLPLTFRLTDTAGETVAERETISYILPGSLQYVVAISVPKSSPISGARVDLDRSPTFTDLPPNLSLPALSTFLRSRARRLIGEQEIEEQKGVLKNDSTFNFKHVSLTALAFDAAGRVTGIGTTFVGELESNEQREFTVQWPKPQNPTTRVQTLATTNIFNEDSIIRASGDPASLR